MVQPKNQAKQSQNLHRLQEAQQVGKEALSHLTYPAVTGAVGGISMTV